MSKSLEVGGSESTDEEQIQEAIRLLRGSSCVVLCCVDDDENLTVIRKGIQEHALPGALQRFAEMLAHILAMKVAEEAIEEAIAKIPDHSKGTCPQCQEVVVMCSPNVDPRALRRPGINARAVCTCGAFLVPYATDDNGLGLRMMTLEEVAALPYETLNQMLAVRKRYAGYSAKARARRERAN